MSSWFSYIRNSIIREEEPNGQPQDSTATNTGEAMVPGTFASASTNSNNSNVEELEEEELQQQLRLSTTVPSLNQEQREHIRDVLRRAERSGRGARVVMDSRHLRTVRPRMSGQSGQQIVPSIQTEIDKENQGGAEDEEAATAPEMMIQMDSLPEDVEITLGPYSYCSYASSELMSEDSEMIDRGYTSRDTGELTTEEPEIVEKTDEEGFTQKMQKLTKKIDSWLKSLDKEDEGDLAMPASSSAGNMVEGKAIGEAEEMVEENGENDDGLRQEVEVTDNVPVAPSSTEEPLFRMPTSKSSVLLSYLDTLSQCICALAMEQSATAQANACLSQFANNLVDAILNSVENELYRECLEMLAIKLVEYCIVEAIKEVERILQPEEEIDDGNYYTILVEDPQQKTSIDQIKWDRMESIESAQTSGADTQISTLEPDENANEERERKMSAENIGIEGEKPAHLIYIEEQIAKLAKEEENMALDEENVQKSGEMEEEESSSSTTTSSADSQPGTIEPIERMSIENPNYEEDESIFSPNKGTSEEASHQIQNTIEDLEGGDDESSGKTSEADSQPGSIEGEMEELKDGQMNDELTQEELDHIERIRRLAVESGPFEMVQLTNVSMPKDEKLTQEELEHIERIKRLAEESSFEAILPGIHPSIPAEVEEMEVAEESSGQTSSADSVPSSFETEPIQLEGSEMVQIDDGLATSSSLDIDRKVEEDEVKEMPKRRMDMPAWKRKMLKKMIAEGKNEDKINSIEDKELAIEEEGIKVEKADIIDEFEAEKSPIEAIEAKTISIAEIEVERSAIEVIEAEISQIEALETESCSADETNEPKTRPIGEFEAKRSALSFEEIPNINEGEEESPSKESFNSPLWTAAAAQILPELVVLSLTESVSQMNAREEPQIPCIVPAPEEFAQMEFGNATEELEAAAKIIQKGSFDEFEEEKGEKMTESTQANLEKMPEKPEEMAEKVEEKEEKHEEGSENVPKTNAVEIDDDWIRQLVFGDSGKKEEEMPSSTFTGKVEIVKPWEDGTKDDAFTVFTLEGSSEEMKPTVEEMAIEEEEQIKTENETIMNETMRPEDEISMEMEEIDQNSIEEVQSAKEYMEEFSEQEKPILIEKEAYSPMEKVPIEEEQWTSPTKTFEEKFLEKVEEEKVEMLAKPILELATLSEMPPPIECFQSELVFLSKDEESLPSSSSTSGADSQPISFQMEEEIGTEIDQNMEKEKTEEMSIKMLENFEEGTKMEDEKEEEIAPSYSGKIDENSEERAELFAKGPEWKSLWCQRTLSIAERSDQKKGEGPSGIVKGIEGIKEAFLEEDFGPISPVELIQEDENLEKISTMSPQIPYSITNEVVERIDEKSSGKTSEADSQTLSIEEEMEMAEGGKIEGELTKEELEHIERIRQLAEKSGPFELVKPTNVPMPKDAELTKEELEHIERIKRLAEESSFEVPMPSITSNQMAIAQEDRKIAEEASNLPDEFEVVEQLNENAYKSKEEESTEFISDKKEEENDNIDRRELFSKGPTWRSIVRQRTMSLAENEFEDKLTIETTEKIVREEAKILKELSEETSGADSPSPISSMPETIEMEESQKIGNEFSELIKEKNDQNEFSEPKFDEQIYEKSISPSSTSGGTVIINEGEGELKDENASIDEEKKEEFMEECVLKSPSSSSRTSGDDSKPTSLPVEEFEQVDVVEEMIKDDQMAKMPSSISSPTSGADSQQFSFEEEENIIDYEIEAPLQFFENADKFAEERMPLKMPSMEILPGNVFAQIPPPPKRPPPPPPQIPKQSTSKNEIDPVKKPLIESGIQPPPRPPLPLISKKEVEIRKENIDGLGQIDESKLIDGSKFIESPKMEPEILTLEREVERNDEESSGKTSEADSQPGSIKEEMEEAASGQMGEELTQEELEHIERIRRLAEESAPFEMVQPKNVSMPKDEKLTKEELEHIEMVKKMAEENANFEFAHPNMPMSMQKDELKGMELTKEELEHIERIKRLAEESSLENAISIPNERNEVPMANLTQISSGEESKIAERHKAYNPFLELIAESNEEFDQERAGKNPFEDEEVAKADRQELFARGKAWKRMVWARTLSLVVEEEQQPSQKDSIKFETQMPIEEEEHINEEEGIEMEAQREAEQIGQIDNLMEKSMGLNILTEQIWPQFEAEGHKDVEEQQPSIDLSFLLPHPTRNEAPEQTEKLLSCFGSNIFVKEEAADDEASETKEEKKPMEIEEDDWIQRLVTGDGENSQIEATTSQIEKNEVEEEKQEEIENIENRMALFSRGQEWRKIARAMTLAEEEEQKATDTVEENTVEMKMTSSGIDNEIVPANARKEMSSSFVEEEIRFADKNMPNSERIYAKSISSSSSSTPGGTVLINEEESELKEDILEENVSIDEEKEDEFAQKSSSSSSSTSGADSQPASSLPAEEFVGINDIVEEAIGQNETQMAKEMSSSSISSQTSGADSPSDSDEMEEGKGYKIDEFPSAKSSKQAHFVHFKEEEVEDKEKPVDDTASNYFEEESVEEWSARRIAATQPPASSPFLPTFGSTAGPSAISILGSIHAKEEAAFERRHFAKEAMDWHNQIEEKLEKLEGRAEMTNLATTEYSSSSSEEQEDKSPIEEDLSVEFAGIQEEMEEKNAEEMQSNEYFAEEFRREMEEFEAERSSISSSNESENDGEIGGEIVEEVEEKEAEKFEPKMEMAIPSSSSSTSNGMEGIKRQNKAEFSEEKGEEMTKSDEHIYEKSISSSSSSTSGGTVQINEEEGELKEDILEEDALIDEEKEEKFALKSSSSSSSTSGADSLAPSSSIEEEVVENEAEQSSMSIQTHPTQNEQIELTKEELEHIERVQKAAETILYGQSDIVDILPMKNEEKIEELANIQRVEAVGKLDEIDQTKVQSNWWEKDIHLEETKLAKTKMGEDEFEEAKESKEDEEIPKLESNLVEEPKLDTVESSKTGSADSEVEIEFEGEIVKNENEVPKERKEDEENAELKSKLVQIRELDTTESSKTESADSDAEINDEFEDKNVESEATISPKNVVPIINVIPPMPPERPPPPPVKILAEKSAKEEENANKLTEEELAHIERVLKLTEASGQTPWVDMSERQFELEEGEMAEIIKGQNNYEEVGQIQEVLSRPPSPVETIEGGENADFTFPPPPPIAVESKEVMMENHESGETSEADSGPNSLDELVERGENLEQIPSVSPPAPYPIQIGGVDEGDDESSGKTSEADSAPDSIVEEIEELKAGQMEVELTQEELEHIERIRRLAEESGPFEMVQSTNVPMPKDEGLTQEELEHIERIKRMAEQSSFEMTNLDQMIQKHAVPPPARPPMPPRSFTLKEEILEDKQLKMEAEESNEKEIAKMELTQEELEQIERVRRMAEQSSFEAMEWPTISIGHPTEPKEMPKDIEMAFHDKIEEHFPIESDVPVNRELTQDELAQIERVQKIAEESGFEPMEWPKMQMIVPMVWASPQREPNDVEMPLEDEFEQLGQLEIPEEIEKSPAEEWELTEVELAKIELDEKIDAEIDKIVPPRPTILRSAMPPLPTRPPRPRTHSQGNVPELEKIGTEKLGSNLDETKKDELTQEELAQIERVQKMAEESGFAPMEWPTLAQIPSMPPAPKRPPPPPPPMAAKAMMKSEESDETSGAYSEPNSSVESIQEEENAENLEEMSSMEPHMPYSNQIENMERGKESPTPNAERSSDESSGKTSEADSKPGSMEEEMEELKDGQTEGELTQDELEHIERIRRLAEESDPFEMVQPTNVPMPKDEELTQEELEHIERIKRLAEESSFEMTNLGQMMPKLATLPPSRPPMPSRSFTLKDEVAEEKPLKMETEEIKEKEICEMELTQEELEQIERVKRLAEQSSFENAIGMPIERKEMPAPPIPIEEEANKMSQIADQLDNEAGNEIVDSEEVPETPLGIPQASRASFSSLQINGANFLEGAAQRTRQSSLTTTVSYTNKMRGRRWLSVTDTSIDQQQQVTQPLDQPREEMPEKSIRKASTSSVKIVFTDDKLRKSFCEDADELTLAPGEATKETTKEEPTEIDEPIQDWTANIDFMARLAFMAQRLTEECAEDAVKDIEAIEQIRHNPRALYFDDKYCGLLKEDIDGLMDGEEDEEEEEDGPMMITPDPMLVEKPGNFIEPTGNNQEQDESVQLAEEPTFQVEPLLDEGNAKSSFGQLFSNILGQGRHRRSSTTERPRSALPFLRRTSPAPPSSPSQRKASAGDAVNGIAAASNASLFMNLLRKSSIASDQGGQFRGELAEDGIGSLAIDLPEEALAGLSEAERAHILRVMAESQRQRLPPPPSSVETSRSPSTILPTSSVPHSPAPTEMNGLNEAEKRHIESVLQKATLGRDSPFIIQQKVIEEEICQKGIEEEEEAKMEELEENITQKEEEKPIGKSTSFGSLFSLQSLSRRLSRVSDKLGELGGTIGQQLAMTATDGTKEDEEAIPREEEAIGPIEREKEEEGILMESNEIEEIGMKMAEGEDDEEELESSKSEETEEADEVEEEDKWEDEEEMEENEAEGKVEGQEEWPELTAAELEHIRRVNEMAAAAASIDDFDDFQFGHLKETAKESPVISVASGILEKANEFAASASAKTTEKIPIEAASLSSKFSTGFQTFASQTKKLKPKSGAGLFGDFASKMRSGLGGQTSESKIVTENAELPAESKPIEKMKETLAKEEKMIGTNLVENMEGAKLPLGQSAEQLSPTSPEFWAIQGGIGQEETENIEEEQPEKSSSSEASTTSSTSSGLGESIVNESSLTSLRSEQAGSQQFFSSSSAGSAHSSLSTLAEQSEAEMITESSSRIEQSTAMIGEGKEDEEVDENARRVVDEISWFKQQLESMNRALMMEGEGDGNEAFQTPPCQPVSSLMATTTNLDEGEKMDGRQISRPIYAENFLDKEEDSLGIAGDDSNSLHSIQKEDGKWTNLEKAGGEEDAKGEQQRKGQNLLEKVTATKTVANDFAIDKTMDNGIGAGKKAPEAKRERTSPEAKSNGQQEGIDWSSEGSDEERGTMAQWPQNAAVPSAAEWPTAWRIETEEEEASKYAGREEIWPKEENAQFGITQEEEEREVVAFDYGTGTCPSIVPPASFTSPLAPHRHSSGLAQSTALEAAASVQSSLPPFHHQSALNRQPEEFVEFASHLPANSSGGEAQNWQQKYYEDEASSRLIGEGNWPEDLGPDLVELPEAQGRKEEEFSAKYLDKEGQKRRASESKISENASIFGLARPTEMRGRAHSTVAAISQEAANLKSSPEENPSKSSASSIENTNQPPPRPQPTIAPKTTTNSFSGTPKMFGPSKSSSSGVGGFGGMFGSKFGKLASNTLKGAKQAGEQLGQRAASAVEKANQALTESVTPSTSLSASTSTPPRPHSSLGFAGPPTSQQSQESRPKSSSLADISLPPGFDQLSEEEQMKIMAVMQCAQLDTELAEAGLISAPQMAAAPSSKGMVMAESPKKSATSVSIRPTADEPDLSGLSEAEQRQIRGVMRAAEAHEQIERERQGIGRDQAMAEHNRMVESGPISVSHEQLSDQAPRRQSTSTGQVPLAQMMDMAKEVTEMVEAEEEEDGLLGTGAIVEGSPSLLENLSKYGQPTLPQSTMNAKEKMEEDEEQWMQPPRPEFTAPPEHWDNVPVTSAVHQRKLWTTVFTEEASAAAGTKSPEIGQGITQMRADEEEELPEISAETVRGCWEMGAGKSAQEILAATTGRAEMGQRQGIGQQEGRGNEESVATIARHIYSQHFEEQQKANESGGQMPASQQRIGSRMLEEQHSNSYEVEMEDPWSPCFTAKSLADAMIAAASVNGTQQGHQKMSQQPQFPPPTIMVTGEKTPTEEDSEEEEEIIGGGEREDGLARERQSTTTSSSSEEEDDYPDQVIKAPTVSPATIAAMQEQNEMEHDKIAAEVLQQIQAFGEAADDEFDVQWAKQPSPQPSQPKQQPQQKTLPKIAANRDNFFMEDAANVYSPPEGPQSSTAPKSIETTSKSTEKPKMPEEKQQNRQQPNGMATANQQQSILYRQRTNPFLVEETEDGQPIGGGEEEEDEDEEEEESGQDVVIRQEHLDAEDGENAASDAERYYKGQFDHSMYFAHRPGPVYTIPENPTEEDKGMAASNREGIYHADRIERKPLHSETVPELIPAEAMAASARRRSRSKSATSSQSSTAAAASSQIEQQKQPQRFWAASSAVQGATATTVAEGAIPPDSSVDEKLTPIRSAPPPPPTEAQMSTGQIEGTVTQSKVGHHPSVNAALHLQQQLQQLNQHKFVNKVKDIAQQEDLPPPSNHVPMLGDDGTEDDLATSSSIQSPRLKRSPAMNLTGLVQSTTADSGISIDQVDKSAEEFAKTSRMVENAQQSASQIHQYQPITTSTTEQQQKATHPQKPQTSSSLPIAVGASSTFEIAPSSTATFISSTFGTAILQQFSQSAAEMGRRRLPSLPSSTLPYSSSGHICSATSVPTITTSATSLPYTSAFDSSSRHIPPQQPSLASIFGHRTTASTSTSTAPSQTSPIIYYTSSAPEKKDVAVNGTVPISTQEWLPEGRVLFDPALVASAQHATLSSRSPPWSARTSTAAVTTTTMANGHVRPYGSVELLPHKSSVLPGATFRPGRTSPAFSRPLSAILPSTAYFPPSTLSTSLSPPRRIQQEKQSRSRTLPPTSTSERATQETLCQLMFKKELRDALAKRKEQLDMCEIEAGHRQYVIDKWMRSGILPQRFLRPAELDAIPAVVKCTLPPELIAGAKIVPSRFAMAHEPPRYGLPSTSMVSAKLTTATLTAASLPQFYQPQQQQPRLVRSIGCQATDGPQTQTAFFATQRSWRQPSQTQPAFYQMPSTSLSAQLRSGTIQTTKLGMAQRSCEASTQTALCAETQTDPRIDIDDFDIRQQQRHWQWPDTTTAAFGGTTFDHEYYQPLERPSQYQQWEDPQQQQRQSRRRRGRLGRFLATADTTSERGRKERMVRDELERRRRELRYSIPDLAEFDQQTQQFYSKPSASYPQHWSGSLPRGLEFGQQIPPPTAAPHSLPISTFTSPQPRRPPPIGYGYGSLPRDYERRMASTTAATAFSPARSSQFDGRFGAQPPPPPISSYSRSMQDLDRLGASGRYPNQYGPPLTFGRTDQQPWPQYPSRSMNYLDRMGPAEAEDFRRAAAATYRPRFAGMADDLATLEQQGPPPADSQELLLSEYANYLNSQFLLDQRQREMAERELMAEMGPPPPLMPTEYYPPAERPPFQPTSAAYYPPSIESQQQQFGRMAPFPTAPGPSVEQPGVYSRSEANYGARPPAQWTQDYGNLYWRQPPLEERPPIYGGYSTAQPYNGIWPGERPPPTNWPMTRSTNPPYGTTAYQSPLQQQRMGPTWNYNNPPATTQMMSAGAAASQRLAQQQQRLEATAPQGILRRRAPPLRSTTTADEMWPKEMADYGWRSARDGGHINQRNESASASHSLPRRSGEIKRLLLTRRYKHENIFKDLGIRVVGGKKLANGDLGAFITSIDKGRTAQETLGELREGDQVLEWNGVLLSGKTYEEVERIMQAGTGEIELIVCSHRKGGTQKKNIYDGDDEEEGDAKINGQNGGKPEEEEDIGARIARITQGCYDEEDWTAGRFSGPKRSRQLAFADDSKGRGVGAGQHGSSSAKWGQSPNEPPPIPAHQSSNSISGEEEGGGNTGRNLPRQTSRPKRSTSSVEREKAINGRMESELDEHPSIGTNGFGGRQTGRLNGSHGYLQLAFAYDQLEQILQVRIIAARALQMRERGIAPNAFVKIYLMPDKKVSNKRRTKYVPHSANPVWDQQVDYSIGADLLARYSLEFTVYDYRRTENHPLGQCTVNLSDPSIVFSGTARWFALQPPPLPSNAEDGGGYGNATLPNGGIGQIEHQRTTTTRFMDYNPATLDILNGYPAIA